MSSQPRTPLDRRLDDAFASIPDTRVRQEAADTSGLREALAIISEGRHPDGHRGAVMVARAALDATRARVIVAMAGVLRDWLPDVGSTDRAHISEALADAALSASLGTPR